MSELVRVYALAWIEHRRAASELAAATLREQETRNAYHAAWRQCSDETGLHIVSTGQAVLVEPYRDYPPVVQIVSGEGTKP